MGAQACEVLPASLRTLLWPLGKALEASEHGAGGLLDRGAVAAGRTRFDLAWQGRFWHQVRGSCVCNCNEWSRWEYFGFWLIFLGWNSRIQEYQSWQVFSDPALPLLPQVGRLALLKATEGRGGEEANKYLHVHSLSWQWLPYQGGECFPPLQMTDQLGDVKKLAKGYC